MELVDLVAALDREQVGTIYAAEPWSCASPALRSEGYPDFTRPVERDGISYAYFLEDFVALEFLDGYRASSEGKSASAEDACNRLIQYAINDA